MKQHIKRLTALALVLLVSVTPSAAGLAALAAQSDTLHITNASEFKAFAARCSTDTYSKGLTVVLDRDIDLSGYGSVVVPVFCGTFDGGHHTISGYDSRGKGSDRGLFRYVKPGASISCLTVSGTMAPQGTKSGLGLLAGRNQGTIFSCAAEGSVDGDESVGGLVGVNEASGIIRDCVSRVTVTASTNAGGIAGRSEGTISGCINQGAVNTDGEQAATNTGGITGKSTGRVENCTNQVEIGHPHVGYNTGGIVGTHNGVITSCANEGKVYGRKDVGGIVGQFEPYMDLQYGTSPLDVLDDALNDLNGLMRQFSNQVSGAAGDAVADVQAMNDALSAIRDTAHAAGSAATADADTMLTSVHTDAQTINRVLDGLIDDTDSFLAEIGKNLEEVNRQMERARKNLMDVPYTLTNGIATATEEIDTAAQAVHEAVGQAQDELSSAKEELERLRTFVQTVGDITLGSGTAQEKLQKLVQALGNLGTVDPVGHVRTAIQAIGQVNDALKRMTENVLWSIAQSNTDIQVSLRGANKALSRLEQLANTIQADTTAYSSNTMNRLQQINESVGTIENTLRGYADTQGDKGQQTMNDVNEQLTILNDRVGQMASGAGETNTDLHATTQAILTAFSQVEDAIKNLVKVPEKTVDDISSTTADSGPGRVTACRNTAAVQADANVGGIVGMIAPELDIDPEQDIDLSSEHLIVDTHALLKATVRDCRNDGVITAKNECAGGIFGRSELGAAIGCVSKSTVEVENGGLAGGIAGQSGSRIENCAAQVDVTGGDSLGGIAGQGTDIVNCRAMTRLDSEGEKLGAVAGSASGTVSGNYYLQEEYAGVDGISYAGQTQGVDFATFAKLDGVPAEFVEFCVTFVANGQTVAQIPVSYGGAVDPAQVPEVPQADGGTHGKWEQTDLTHLVRSQTVYAIYDDLRSTVASPGAHPALLAEGAFSPEAAIDVQEWIPEATQIPQGYRLVAAYTYAVHDDAPVPDTLTLHVQAGDDGTAVAVRKDGQSEMIDSRKDGSYLIFDGTSEGMILVLQRDNTPLFIALGVVGVVLVLMIGVVIHRRRKRRKERAAVQNNDTPEQQATEPKTAEPQKTE